jgi:hypothetical protein
MVLGFKSIRKGLEKIVGTKSFQYHDCSKPQFFEQKTQYLNEFPSDLGHILPKFSLLCVQHMCPVRFPYTQNRPPYTLNPKP